LSVGVGLGVLAELLEEEVVEVVGAKGKHDADRVTLFKMSLSKRPICCLDEQLRWSACPPIGPGEKCIRPRSRPSRALTEYG
jgi:hypothetical protein